MRVSGTETERRARAGNGAGSPKALAEGDDNEVVDSEYLERLRPLATPLTLAEGEAKVLDLKLIGGL